MGPRTCWILPLIAVVVSAQSADDSCPPDTCGEKAICKMLNGAPKCECPEGHFGNPWRLCVPECEKDSDCSSSWFCEKSRCQPVCSAKTCAQGADCSVVDHHPVCECPPGFKGNPRTQCLPECAKSSDCPSNMVCYYPRCVDPCPFSCGKDALCEVNNRTTVCRCPKGMAGYPLERCKPMTPEDLCSPNPCGKNAKCTASKDREGYPVPSCSCQPGYYGSPLIECKKGDCIRHADCSDVMVCRSNQCVNPCKENVCPPQSTCMVQSHRVYCSRRVSG